jgi:hypothetical protein
VALVVVWDDDVCAGPVCGVETCEAETLGPAVAGAAVSTIRLGVTMAAAIATTNRGDRSRPARVPASFGQIGRAELRTLLMIAKGRHHLIRQRHANAFRLDGNSGLTSGIYPERGMSPRDAGGYATVMSRTNAVKAPRPRTPNFA